MQTHLAIFFANLGDVALQPCSQAPTSSETQGQLVGTKEFLWAKVYCNRATSPWALSLTELVPEAFEFPAIDWPEKNQRRGPAGAFLHEVVFLIDRHSCVGRSKGGFSTRFSQKFSEVEQITNLIWPVENTEKIFMADLSKDIVKLYG